MSRGREHERDCDERDCDERDCDERGSTGFALIVVLFILLVIVGAAWIF